MKNKKLYVSIISVILVLATCLATFVGCSLFGRGDVNDLADQLAPALFSNDALSANFFFEDADAYLGERPSVSLAEPQSKEDYETNCDSFKSQAALMAVQYKYSKMSSNDKELFAFLQDYFILQSKFKDYYYLQTSYIGGYSGMQASLPTLLTEYKFRDKNDVDDFISVCALTTSVFPKWVSYEQARLDNGFGRSAGILLYAVEQCADFTGAPIIKEDYTSIEDALDCANPNPTDAAYIATANYVLTEAIAKLNATSFTSAEKHDYAIKLTNAVNNNLIPAYITLGNSIKDMLRNAGNQQKFKSGGLYKAYGDVGRNYYSLLLQESTGTNATPQQVYADSLAAYNATLSELATMKTTLANTFGVNDVDAALNEMFAADEAANWDETTLNATLQTLKGKLSGSFPAMAESSGEIKTKIIDESLKEHYAPAAYYVSPLDNKNSDEVIVINNWDSTGYLSYDLLSHEGIPGHLYQHNYLKNSDKHDVIKVLCPTAYKEGWATYAEHYVAKLYGAANSKENLLMQFQVKRVLAKGYLRVMADILVNYQGYGGTNNYEGDVKTSDVRNSIEYWLENEMNISSYPYLIPDGETAGTKSSVRDFAAGMASYAVLYPCNAATYYYSYLQVSNIIAALKNGGRDDLAAHTALLDSPYTFTQIKEKFGI